MLVDNNREFVDSREGFSNEEEMAYFAQQSLDSDQSYIEFVADVWSDTPQACFRIRYTTPSGAERVCVGSISFARTLEGRGCNVLLLEHLEGYTQGRETLEEHCDSETRDNISLMRRRLERFKQD